jgi:hypothetical protein
MVTRMRSVTVPGLVDEVTTILERIFAGLEVLGREVERLYAAAGRSDARPAAADLADLRPWIIGNLGGVRELVVGSGYISAPGGLADRERWLEWWKCERDGRPSRLVLNLDPRSDGFVDYTGQPWFAVPRDRGRRHVTGPFVDYLCTDEYTLTFTTPVHHDGAFVGVVGSDVYVSGFESAVLPRLRALGHPAFLVNGHGRVIVSNTVRRVAGSLVRDPDVTALWPSGPAAAAAGHELHPCGDFPIALLVQHADGRAGPPRPPSPEPSAWSAAAVSPGQARDRRA